MTRLAFLGIGLIAAALLGGCGPKNEGFRPPEPPPSSLRAETASARSGQTAPPSPRPAGASPDQVGLATWYGGAFAGKKTASGERFDPNLYTAAHRSLPFGTWVEVRRVDTGSAVRVRINDRGPWGDKNRVIDLSRKAAEDLGIVRAGLARVELRVVRGP